MKLTPLKKPITQSVTYRKYSDGKIYAVWLNKSGKIRRRIANRLNRTDASSKNKNRTIGFVNTTDRPGNTKGRVQHKRSYK